MGARSLHHAPAFAGGSLAQAVDGRGEGEGTGCREGVLEINKATLSLQLKRLESTGHISLGGFGSLLRKLSPSSSKQSSWPNIRLRISNLASNHN